MGFPLDVFEGGRVCRKKSRQTFPYPGNKESSHPVGPSLSQRFGRFTYTPSALNVHCPDKEFMAVCFLDNVRSYQTKCS